MRSSSGRISESVTPRLEGKVAVVTGAAQGIGRSHTERLVAEGASVLAVDLSEEGLDRLGRIPGVQCVLADVSAGSEARRVREAALKAFGGVDILVNNAGGTLYAGRSLLDMTEDKWDRIHSVNLKGQWLMAQALVPLMCAREGGRIINTTSATALTGDAGVGAYGSAKAGVIGLTRALATECGEFGITVNAIAPGLIRVLEPKPALSPEAFEQAAAMWLVRQKIKRCGEVWDVSSAMVFLASDDAAFITGQVLLVDGGSVYG
jgi:NAD(P)-dependent dehydrogenase (short-subunit alcohol dehydrogenase family)